MVIIKKMKIDVIDRTDVVDNVLKKMFEIENILNVTGLDKKGFVLKKMRVWLKEFMPNADHEAIIEEIGDIIEVIIILSRNKTLKKINKDMSKCFAHIFRCEC